MLDRNAGIRTLQCWNASGHGLQYTGLMRVWIVGQTTEESVDERQEGLTDRTFGLPHRK